MGRDDMTNIIEEAEIINAYLCKIKKSLPLGIRLKRDELNDILDEIEEHLWEIAIESAGDNEPNELDVQIAISQMGEPQNIAGKFTNRSTPYVYISEELYPSYTKFRKILFWSSILTFAIHALSTSFLPTILSFFLYYRVFLIIGMSFTSIIIIGLVFYYLSMTGYIPYEIRRSKMQKRYSNTVRIQKPKFRSYFHIFIICVEISFFIFNVIFIVFWVGLDQLLIILSIIKILRGFTKTKSVMWQRSLIIVDIFFTSILFIGLEETIYFLFEVRIYFNYFSPVSQEVIYIVSIFMVVFILYIYYEVYLFVTLKEKQEHYLKELSLIKRIKKKESILRTSKNYDRPSVQDITRNKQALAIKSSEIDIEHEDVIKTYLNRAKRKLPFWLKRAEKREVIKNLENEIREAILDFEESSQLTHEKLKGLLTNLVNIKIILSEYKQQGTPKIFISKELWSWYLTTLKSFLVYFVFIFIFLVILQASFNASFWFFLLILILILVTQLFTFFSLNDIIPEKTEILGTKTNKTIGTILIFKVFTGKFSINFPGSNLIFTISGFLLLLAVIKILKIIFKRKKVILKTILIILSLVLSFVINFIIVYNYQSKYLIIYTISASDLLNLLFLPINIEIIYETFHFFFQFINRKW